MSEINDLTVTQPTLLFSTLRVSTITTTAQLGTKIALDALFDQIKILPYWDLNDGILKMDFRGKTKGTSFKDIMSKPKEKKTSFFNQATLVIRNEISPLNWKEINVKLFRNGGIQMTGVRSLEMASKALKWLIPYIQANCTSTEKPVFTEAPNIHKEETQLINTDFSIGTKVRREVLHRVLSDVYKLHSSYESAIYQGVKTKYFYNAERPADAPRGVCPCPRLCKGSGDGTKLGQCKKITISPFQTGNGIITGARTMAQINEAYDFIQEVFRTHAESILRKVYTLPPESAIVAANPKPKIARPAVWIQHPCPRNILKVNSDLSNPGADKH